MKFLSKKFHLKALIAIFLLLSAYSTQATKLPWYQRFFQQAGNINYSQNCRLISIGQKIRYAALMLYYCTTHKKEDLDQALTAVETELKNFEKELLDLEQETLESIKQKYSINDEIWQACLADITKVKNSYRVAMCKAYPGVTHDPALPEDTKNVLIMLLKQNNINPNSVKLTMASQKETHAKPTCLADTTYSITSYDSETTPDISQEYIPAQITIFPTKTPHTPEEIMSICAHEVQHLVLQHSITELVLYEYFRHYCIAEKEVFQQTKEYRTLCKIHEAQAEILAALSNPAVARCFKSFRKKMYYPNVLYEDHFYDLAQIDILWKLHDKLEGLYFC